MPAFDDLVTEALAAPVSGWDFSWLGTGSAAGRLPWSYRREVARRAALAGVFNSLVNAFLAGDDRSKG